jgi:Carboxymuconolactone decarboxylase family
MGLAPQDEVGVCCAVILRAKVQKPPVAGQPRNLQRADLSTVLRDDVSEDSIVAPITHMAFYAGWPAAMSAAQVAYTVLVEGNKGE